MNIEELCHYLPVNKIRINIINRDDQIYKPLSNVQYNNLMQFIVKDESNN